MNGRILEILYWQKFMIEKSDHNVAVKGVRKGGWGWNPPLSLIFYKKFIIRRVYRAWFFTKIRGVCVEEYAYYVNKLRLKTWIWRQIVTSQTAQTKYKWPPSATEWTPPWKFSAYATGCCSCYQHLNQSLAAVTEYKLSLCSKFWFTIAYIQHEVQQCEDNSLIQRIDRRKYEFCARRFCDEWWSKCTSQELISGTTLSEIWGSRPLYNVAVNAESSSLNFCVVVHLFCHDSRL